jgi:hypothetical protein
MRTAGLKGVEGETTVHAFAAHPTRMKKHLSAGVYLTLNPLFAMGAPNDA